MKNFKFLWKRIKYIVYNIWFFLTIGRLPATKKCLQIDVTSKCNLRCKGCYHFSSPVAADLSDEALLSFLKDKASEGYRKLWLFGGEPALRADLFSQLNQWFLDIHVISNGTIKIDPIYHDWSLWISLDGPEEINDAIRGKGAFWKVVNNYRGDKRVGLVMTVNRKNYQHIPQMVQLVKEIGVSTISFTFYSRCQGETLDEFDFTPEDLAAVEKIVLNELKQNGKQMLIDKASLQSMLYGKINGPKWGGKCFFAEVLLESYDSSGKRRKCCINNIICEGCRIHPPHQFHTFMVTKKSPWWEYALR
ncbi:MAG: radical SAM protein [Candidatus Saganbacteria bacterium]|nr:radical SAM protein [Candidatus Saganbacteria bacterium]